MKNNKEKGKAGEDKASVYLKSLGYEIIERNFRSRFGEIDIIARNGNDIVFVEVKARRNNDYGMPQEAVGKRKQDKLRKLALLYLEKASVKDPGCRFDVVSIITETGEIEHIKDAF